LCEALDDEVDTDSPFQRKRAEAWNQAGIDDLKEPRGLFQIEGV
jgi:hypothetical protein